MDNEHLMQGGGQRWEVETGDKCLVKKIKSNREQFTSNLLTIRELCLSMWRLMILVYRQTMESIKYLYSKSTPVRVFVLENVVMCLCCLFPR